MTSPSRRAIAALLLAGVVATATACVPVPALEAEPSLVPTRESTPVLPVPASSAPASVAPDDVGDVDAEDVDYAAALLEREAFFGERQQPLDSAILSAATDAQRQFIAVQRAYTESQGGEWSAEAETIALAVSLDACESAILNGHRFAADNFRAHLVTSPLFHDLAGDDPQRRQGLTEIMLTGMSFLCPDDVPQWDEASREVLGP